MDADPTTGSGVRPLDYLGRPLSSGSASGGWNSALFVIGVEIAERFAYYGVSSNLITYLTGPLGQSTASAAANVNAWGGVASMLPLLGGFLADAYIGRYRTIVFASLLYVLTSQGLSSLYRPNGQQESSEEVEAAQGTVLIRLLPIAATCLIYAVVSEQPATLFTKQGSTMDRRLISPSLLVPPAALQSFTSLSIVTFLPIYDRAVVPLARKLTGVPTGVTMLQRIGIGMALSIAAMAAAALVEMKRLRTAREFGLVDLPGAVVPMSLWWLVPQYVLYGISDVFILVGLQEFFYDQVPDGLRSLGLALYLCIFGIGGFLSSFLVSVIDRASRRSGEYSWFSDNLNRAHLDYFYWLLAGLSVVGLLLFLCFARVFQYKKKG